MGIINYITENSYKPGGVYYWNGLEVQVDDKLPDNIDLGKVLETIKMICPSNLLEKVKSIKIGNYQKLRSRGVDAIFDSDSNLIITNDQDNNYDIMNDIVHEMAHIAEDIFSNNIYSDDKIKYELVNKREKLRNRLKYQGYDTNQYDCKSLKYDKLFDNFLWKDIGYSNLAQMSHDIFLSPYAATSLREYWADAFEDYFLKDPNMVKQYSPAVYEKINNLF